MDDLPQGDMAIWSEYERADGQSVIVARCYTAEQMRAYRREALEDAARVCEDSPYPDGADCADAIRALIDQPKTP